MSAEPPNPSGLPGRNRPHLSDLSRETTEEDLWNLDEEEATAQPVQPRQPKPAPEPPAKKSLPVLEAASPGTAELPPARGLHSPVKRSSDRATSGDEIGELDEDFAESTPASPAVASPIDDRPAPAAKVTSAPKTPAPQHEPKAPEELLEGMSSTRENRPRGAGAAAKASLTPRLNRREVIGIASFAVVALIASAWVLTRFFTLLSFTSDSDGKPDYPLKGELVQIASGSTFWREPVRTGENRDFARREVVIIPVLELTLDSEKAASGGALRVIFRNAEGTPVGDAITRTFAAGRFESSGSDTASFAATDGFNTEGEFQGYRGGAGKLWVADVLEGPPGGSPASAFKKLSSIPIFPERR